jgi:cell wall-associated NlpC family hydrolase
VNGKPRTIVIPLLLTSLLLLLFATFASQAPASPVSAKKAHLHEVQAQLQTVYHKADMAVEKYNQATSQLQTVQQQIRENGHLLRVAEYNLEIARQQLQARAQDIYKTRDVGFVDVLFAANSFDDLVTQMNLMERLGNSDVDTARSIAAYQGDIKDRRVKLDADKKVAAGLVKQRAAQKSQILGLQSKLEQMTAGIKSQLAALEAAQAAAAERAAQTGAADPSTGTPPSGSIDPGGPGHPEVVAIAQRYLGVPYVWGGATPSGFDCSGLTMYCYVQIGIGLAHGATAQQQASQEVSLNNLLPGDLVFFGGPSYSGHVGIYVGGGTMIDAPHHNAVVRYDSIAGAWIGGRF